MTFTPPDKYRPRTGPGPGPAPPLWTAASPLARRGTSPGAARPSGCARPLEQRGQPSPAPRSPPPRPSGAASPRPPSLSPTCTSPFGCACPSAGLHDPLDHAHAHPHRAPPRVRSSRVESSTQWHTPFSPRRPRRRPAPGLSPPPGPAAVPDDVLSSFGWASPALTTSPPAPRPAPRRRSSRPGRGQGRSVAGVEQRCSFSPLELQLADWATSRND